MKKLMLIVFLSGFVFGGNATIGALFSDILHKCESKKYNLIAKNIYSLNSGFNVKWITDGIKHPTTQESNDNGFNINALKKIIKNSNKFVPIAKSKLHKPLKRGFIKSFKDDNPNGNFMKDLKNDKNVYVLGVLGSKSSIVVYKDRGDFKLVWWKEMIRVANSLK
jgi:hypothetical protein